MHIQTNFIIFFQIKYFDIKLKNKNIFGDLLVLSLPSGVVVLAVVSLGALSLSLPLVWIGEGDKKIFLRMPSTHSNSASTEMGAVLKISVSTDISILGFYGYIDGYFYMNIDILKINKNTLKFMKIHYKSVRMTLIMIYRN